MLSRIPEELLRKMQLDNFFNKYPRVAIAFSGGSDSAFLAYSALKYAKEVRAYFVKTAFQPEFEYQDVIRFTNEYSLDLKVIELDILSEEEVVCNPSNRCYYCKKKIFSVISKAVKEDGFEVILDGSNASDDASDRPGMKALEELKILSPLRMCNLTKDDIRRLSKEANLFTWNKPSYACLATRVPSNVRITKDILDKTEKAEAYLSSLGFNDFRVRYRDGNAFIQLVEEQFDLYYQKEDIIKTELLRDYQDILLDSKPRIKTVGIIE